MKVKEPTPGQVLLGIALVFFVGVVLGFVLGKAS